MQTIDIKTTSKLTPITKPWMTDLMSNQVVLNELVVKYGSPINIHNLKTFSENIQNFKDVFSYFNIQSQIYYARKANKTKALAKQALANDIGIDTASYNELKQAVELGGKDNSVVLTSAIKTEEQIYLAIANNVTIIVDNDDECQLINRIAKSISKKAKIGFRISGFLINGKKLYSRFGFDVDTVVDYIKDNVGSDKNYNSLTVIGLHFHLDGYSIEHRGIAAIECMTIAKILRDALFPITFVDMGGGILINYLKEESEWNTFKDQLIQQTILEQEHLTFKGDGLGFTKEDDKIYGKLDTYPYYNSINGTNFLKEVLETKHPITQISVANMAKENDIELRIEPGRSLLNGVGITVSKVAHRKKDSKGQYLVGLEMNMTQMKTSSADYLVDPYVLYNNDDDKEVENSNPVDVYFTGAYCLERDIILKRKISLPKLPEVGDLVVFVNTAGYFMHFFETEAHLFELSKNLIYAPEKQVSLLNFIDDERII